MWFRFWQMRVQGRSSVFKIKMEARLPSHSLRSITVALSAVLATTACQTLTPKQCRQADWQQIGRADGEHGRPLTKLKEHRQICQAHAEINNSQYLVGWQQGVQAYCRPDNAYQIGVEGFLHDDVCPKNQAEEFQARYMDGRKLFLTRLHKLQLENKIAENQERREKDKSVINHIGQTFNLLTGRDPDQELKDRSNKLTDEINAMEIAAPVTGTNTLQREQSHRTGVSVLGALLGTVVGFGSGHAIQGRYMSGGWMWTAGEVATLASVSVAEHNDPEGQSASWVMLGWLGFRVWQSVDLWRNAFGSYTGYGDISQKSPTPLMLGVGKDRLLFAYRF
ncbi:MAG: DUF2799 domain-containing protein [Bdellovibrionales bacterium]